MKALFGKQPKSYWLSSLGLLIVLLAAWILFGILLRIGVDYQRNTQGRPWASPDAILRGYSVPKVVTAIETEPGQPLAPYCTYSVYREGGEGISVEWKIGDGGFTAPWTAIKQTWSCG